MHNGGANGGEKGDPSSRNAFFRAIIREEWGAPVCRLVPPSRPCAPRRVLPMVRSTADLTAPPRLHRTRVDRWQRHRQRHDRGAEIDRYIRSIRDQAVHVAACTRSPEQRVERRVDAGVEADRGGVESAGDASSDAKGIALAHEQFHPADLERARHRSARVERRRAMIEPEPEGEDRRSRDPAPCRGRGQVQAVPPPRRHCPSWRPGRCPGPPCGARQARCRRQRPASASTARARRRLPGRGRRLRPSRCYRRRASAAPARRSRRLKGALRRRTRTPPPR